MTTTTTRTVRVSRIIDADAAAVFAAWTEPEHLREWSCPEGATVGDATVALRVGGAYRLRIRDWTRPRR